MIFKKNNQKDIFQYFLRKKLGLAILVKSIIFSEISTIISEKAKITAIKKDRFKIKTIFRQAEIWNQKFIHFINPLLFLIFSFCCNYFLFLQSKIKKLIEILRQIYIIMRNQTSLNRLNLLIMG